MFVFLNRVTDWYSSCRGNLTTRIVWSICIALVVFIVTVILAMVDTEHMKHEFFWITMVSVIILNSKLLNQRAPEYNCKLFFFLVANGIYQNTIYGMAAKLPPKYTGSVVLGSNISGAFTAVVSILSKKMASDKRMAAIYYFITAIFTLLICFDTYFALPLNVSKYY